jgi:serine/threonine protein kinase
VKPANFLIEEPSGHLYLTDFGIAKLVGTAGLTKTGSFLGTVDYCAPEQIEGKEVDARADVYALGCVLYQCLTGQTPFPKDSDVAVIHAHLMEPPPAVSRARADIPETLDGVVMTAMAKHPDLRFHTCIALADAVRDAFAGGETQRVAAPTAVRPVPTLRREPAPPTTPLPSPTVPPTKVAAPGPRGKWPIWVLVAIVAAAGIAAAVVFGTGGGGHGSGRSAAMRTFAMQVGNLLETSANGRGEIAAALARATSCAITPAAAVASLASVAENRQGLLQQVLSLNPPNPEAQRIDLLFQDALEHSRESNRHYRAWLGGGTETDGSCTYPRDGDYAAARREDGLATKAKRRFLTEYNPVARTFGLRTWRETEI